MPAGMGNYGCLLLGSRLLVRLFIEFIGNGKPKVTWNVAYATVGLGISDDALGFNL